MPGFNKLEAHPMVVPIAEVIGKAISFINILLLIRIFSIDEYADYSYMIAVILWASVLMDAGINDLVYNKSLLKDPHNINTLFSSKVYLSLSVIIFILIYFLYNEPTLASSALILSFVILFSSLSALFKMYSRGNGIVRVDIVTILSEPLFRLFFLVLIYLSGSVISLKFWQFFLVYLLAGLLSFTVNYKHISPFFKFKLETGKLSKIFKSILKTFKETKYFFLYYLMLIGLQRVDIILIEKYSTKENLAIFSSAITLFQVAHLFFFSLLTSKFLLFFKNRKLRYPYLLAALLLLVLLSSFLSPYLYKFLFPVEYLNGFSVFNIIILSLIPSVYSLYFILKNNYLGKAVINFYILFSVLILKFLIYSYFKFSETEMYSIVYVIIEWLLVFIFLIQNRLNESSPDQ